MIVVVCPGQGSQTPGFLEPWIAEPAYRATLEQLGEAAGVDLVAHGTTSDADTIRDTAIAQPLIVAAGILTLDALFGDSAPGTGRRDRVGGIAGHSVGEITAAAGAGILANTDAMRIVGERGRAMADAAALTQTGMSAVVGGNQDELLALFDEVGVIPANYNGGGQIVVAGAPEALATLSERAPRGVRVIPLQVAGAFHTHFMAPAVERLAAVAATVTPADPTLPIWTNNDGSLVTSGARYLDLVVGQVSSPVRWDLCMESFAAAGVTGLIEVAPAGALVGLAKRGLKGIPSVAVKTPDDLASAFDLLDQAA